MNPNVSVVMPTCVEHHSFLPQAFHDFANQDYDGDLQLVVVTDDQPIHHLIPNDPRITYVHTDTKLSIGDLRNLASEHCIYDLITSQDSDDRYAPNRITEQVKFHLASGMAVSGIGLLTLHDTTTDVFTTYDMAQPYASGCSLMYEKAWWVNHPFPSKFMIGEDTDFISEAARHNQMASNHDSTPVLMVALTHPHNHSDRTALYRTNQWKLTTKPEWY